MTPIIKEQNRLEVGLDTYTSQPPNGWVPQQYLPNKIKNKQYYAKKTGKFEQALSTVYERLQSSHKMKNKG